MNGTLADFSATLFFLRLCFFLKMAQAYFQAIMNSPLQGYKVCELRALARANKIKNYSTLRKLDLICLLVNNNVTPTTVSVKPTTNDKDITVKELKELAAVLLIKGFSKMKKAELISTIEITLEEPSPVNNIKTTSVTTHFKQPKKISSLENIIKVIDSVATGSSNKCKYNFKKMYKEGKFDKKIKIKLSKIFPFTDSFFKEEINYQKIIVDTFKEYNVNRSTFSSKELDEIMEEFLGKIQPTLPDVSAILKEMTIPALLSPLHSTPPRILDLDLDALKEKNLGQPADFTEMDEAILPLHSTPPRILNLGQPDEDLNLDLAALEGADLSQPVDFTEIDEAIQAALNLYFPDIEAVPFHESPEAEAILQRPPLNNADLDRLHNELDEFLKFHSPPPKPKAKTKDVTEYVTRKPTRPKMFCKPRQDFRLGQPVEAALNLNEIFPFHEDLFYTKNLVLNEIFPFLDSLFYDMPAYTGGGGQYINIIQTSSRHVSKFNTHLKDFKINIKKEKIPKNTNIINDALNEMTAYAKKNTDFQDGDKINIVVENPNFFYPISTGYEKEEDLVGKLQEKVSQILTSDQTCKLEECTFRVHIVNLPRGATHHSKRILNLATDKHTKTCIVEIKNKDNLCCPRAVITGLTYHTKVILGRTLSANDVIYIRKGRVLQTTLANEVCNQLGDYNKEGFTLEDIKNLEALLDIQINVVCAENFNSVIYRGEDKPIKIYIYKNGNHFDTITKMNAFFGQSYFCHTCNKPYNNKNRHTCKVQGKKLCPLCRDEQHDLSTKSKRYCPKCNRYCYNEQCLNKHLCDTVYKCRECGKLVTRALANEHACGHEKCPNCKETVETATHRCYMLEKRAKGGRCAEGCQKCKENKKCSYTEKYIFFDYEAQQETGIHIPNLVIAHDFQGNVYNFENNDKFCEWLISKKHSGYTAIAHYARGYDSQFIMQYCVKNTLLPYTIYVGSKLMLLEIPTIKLKIIDSHNFVQSPLSAFPKTFGLSELKKGYFPHLFNTVANANYVGPLPDKQFYCYDTMNSAARKEFLKWYEVRIAEGYVFDLQKELYEYCNSDVDILRRGCMVFRELFLEIANIDPFQYLTTPSVCMAIYRSNYLMAETVAIAKTPVDQYSKSSITWLNSFENPNIRHASSGGEIKICGAKVDGYDEITKTVYQYHGCFWHGCPKCYHEDTVNNVNRQSMGDLYERTLERTRQLEMAGYRVVEMWACEETKKKKSVASNEDPLNPRDAFFGGRTEVFKLKTEGKKVRYIDVCSLYPTVMFYDNYPKGHPTKIITPNYYDSHWYGLIKCKVTAPSRLYVPVLPVRVKTSKSEKLIFPLCVKCAVENNQAKCTHTDEERAFVGTWSTVEVNKAIEKGYQVEEIYEVWHFEKSTELWKGYIRDFMKIKLETSPHNYPTNEVYAAAVLEKEGIRLDLEKIAPNPGKRAISKLCLNSLWGKFGQRTNKPQTTFISEPCEFYQLLLDDALTDMNVMYLNDEMIQANYKRKQEFEEDHHSTNIFIAIYTTANARLRLYEQLANLDRAVIYGDTDSIFYIDDGVNTVKTGDCLGEWTDELGGSWITKMVATGPKSYYYKTNTGKECTKVKGFTLHHRNAQKINGEALEQLIDGATAHISTCNNRITRDKLTKNLVNKEEVKNLAFTFDKRVIQAENYDTLPFGFL